MVKRKTTFSFKIRKDSKPELPGLFPDENSLRLESAKAKQHLFNL
jgi:hypothetical protein